MGNNSVKKILILAANPKNSTSLRLDEEVREIDEGLTRAKQRDRFELVQKWAVRPRDVQRAILNLTPQIVHFSGHGVGVGVQGDRSPIHRKLVVVSDTGTQPEGLMFEDETGQAKLVGAEAIAGLFELFADQVECVLLNACYSEVQAVAIARHIPYVIGMNRAVGDTAARVFAVGFYDALGAGRDIEFAYKFACNSILMEGIPENLTPVLKKRLDLSNPMPITVNLEELGGQVPLDSPFYIPRPPIEERCYEAIIKPGALIRIKAPRQMGKSSLMLRILDCATQQGYRSVWLNLQAAGEKALENPDSLLKWLCSRISRKLGLPDKVEEYWQGALGSNDKCTDYFELYLLEELKKPFALGLDEVDELFQYESVAGDFFGLLRSWHEESKFNPVWRNLRLIIAHSKEVYIPLNINQSPFNVGLPVDLPPLNDDQVADLIQRHGLNLPPRESVKLMDLTGGHPYLLRVALYSLARKEISFEQLLKIAPTAEWAYGEHLRRHLNSLEEHPELLAAMKQVIAVETPVRIAASEAFKLSSMGLVRFHENEVVPLCDLYRQYFREMLK
jgi:hypothetical protein